jgi:hypothetical protein
MNGCGLSQTSVEVLFFSFYCLVIPNTRGCRNKSWAEVKLATTAAKQK